MLLLLKVNHLWANVASVELVHPVDVAWEYWLLHYFDACTRLSWKAYHMQRRNINHVHCSSEPLVFVDEREERLKVVPINLLTLIAIAHALKRGYTAAYDWLMQRVIARFSSQAMVVTRSAAKQHQHTQEGLQQAIQRLKDLPQVQHEPVSSKFAAVLVPLFQDQQGVLRVWLTRRAQHLNSHQGEVCLPGGKRDPTDPDDAFTALREAHEEMGLSPDDAQSEVQLLYHGHEFVFRVQWSACSKLAGANVVAQVPSSFVPLPNPEEVDAVFSMPLNRFLDAHQHMHWDMRGKSSRLYYRIHSFDYEGFIIWGLTAAIMIRVAQLALGRPADFEVDHPSARM
eukprot:gene6020-6260_t